MNQTLGELGCKIRGEVNIGNRTKWYKSNKRDAKGYRKWEKYTYMAHMHCNEPADFVTKYGLVRCQCTRIPVKTSVSNTIESSTSLHHNGTHNATHHNGSHNATHTTYVSLRSRAG